jgi:outer membrane protein assembly factor BamA
MATRNISPTKPRHHRAAVVTDWLAACIFAASILPGTAAGEALPDGGNTPTASTQPVTFALASAPWLIGSINIVTDNVFDIDDPAEDKALYRLVNRAHIRTHPEVIAQQLLFKPGDPLLPRDLEESERILRSNRYLQDAHIEAVPNNHGLVDVNVRTTDAWTLIPKISLSRSGGENEGGIGLKEMNLFGKGMEVEALYKSDVDRDSKIIRFTDRHLRNSWYSLHTLIADNSDGHSYALSLARPFYALNSTSAHGFAFLDNDEVESLYDRGEIVEQFRDESGYFELFTGWSAGLADGWTRRLTAGLAYEEHRFSQLPDSSKSTAMLPDDRKFVYPFIGLEIVEDRFEETRNLDQINRTEDLFLGTRVAGRLGAASESFGSDSPAWLVSADAQTGLGAADRQSLILTSSLAGRLEGDGWHDLTISVGARYYNRQSEKRLFVASLAGTYGYNLDLDQQLLLGGDNGLRGYPLRYQTGDRSVLLTLEQRLFSDWYPFRLFRVGGAVFFDAGRVWGDSPVANLENEVLKDVGVGLRIGNTRSGQGRMTHIDLAFPLDGDAGIQDVQFLIETKKSF